MRLDSNIEDILLEIDINIKKFLNHEKKDLIKSNDILEKEELILSNINYITDFFYSRNLNLIKISSKIYYEKLFQINSLILRLNEYLISDFFPDTMIIKRYIKHINNAILEFINMLTLMETESEFSLNEKEIIITELEKKISELKNKNNENHAEEIHNLESTLQDERNEKELLKSEIKQYKNELVKIEKAISKLKTPADELTKSKKHYEKVRDKYMKFADNLFYVAISLFIVIVTLIFISFGFDVFSKKTDWSLYLIMVFPVIFPTLISFLFVRQSNIKSLEIEKINKRFILIHEVNQSLEALVEVNRGKDMDGKTEQVIDKLINNILDFATEGTENTNQKNDIYELNTKLDQVINTIKSKTDASDLAS